MALNSVVVKIDPPTSFSSVSNDPKNKQKVASAKQVTWVLLLRLQRLFSLLSMAAPGPFHFIKKRVTLSDVGEEDSKYRGRLYGFIRLFLAISVVGLIIEMMAYFQEWDLKIIHNLEVHGLVEWCYRAWFSFRVDYVAPAIIYFSQFCIVLFMIQSVDRFVLGIGCIWIKWMKLKPEIKGDEYDIEDSSSFPMVLVQIPMCNEKEVFTTSISAVCQLDWPKERFLIQVLDDSDDEIVRELISDEVSSWRAKGVNIVYRHRFIRTGYKAGNLKSAMLCDYVKDYEFVAIFDADFQPNSDYLKLTIPHFKGNPDIGLVQARWAFVNKEENLLTRLQNINLCFHFEVEQQVNGIFLNFFGFNGTAGVWRIKALEESGGWLERTTVEDMDIAVRAHLSGWKFICLNDVRVLCELPECFEAYKKQQYRWHSGPMQLFRLCFRDVLSSQISKWKKANLIFLFFLLRKLILPFYSFTLFCIILPLTMFVPEAELPVWVICYVPITLSIINILPDPKSFPFMIPYLLFENTMSVTKFNAMISGLFQLGSSYEWIVTKKTGRSSKSDLSSLAIFDTKIPNNKMLQRGSSDSHLDMLDKLKKQAPVSIKKKNKVYRKELALAFLLLTAAARSLLCAHGIHFYYLLFQGLGFLVVGLDLVGEQVD